MKSKTIIISSQSDISSQTQRNGRGILTLFQEDDLLKCRLRLYNVNKLSRYCKLGIYHNNEVFSANLLEKNGVYESSFVGDFDIDKDFYTAIIDTANNNDVILSGGTYAGFYFDNTSVFENGVNDYSNNFKNIEKENPNTNLYNYDDEDSSTALKEINTNELNEEFGCDKCAKCKYKEYFYSNHEDKFLDYAKNDKEILPRATLGQNDNQQCHVERNEVEPKQLDTYAYQNDKKENENTNTSNENENKKSVIQAIIPQFKYVFENYEQDQTLNNLIPNSKFVKINENNEQYSIGAIYDNEDIKYLCYAVMCNYNAPAPLELGEHYQWLPLDKEDPLSEGYYIVFQDAKDLKILEL